MATNITRTMVADDNGLYGADPAAEEAAGSYLRALSRYWQVALLITLVVLAAAAATVARRTRSYQATANVLVSPLSSGGGSLSTIGAVSDSGDPARNVQTAAALLDSPAAAAAAAQTLGRGWSRAGVENAISITPRGQSNVLSITATGSSPAQAQRLANAFTTASLANRAAVVQANVHSELSQLEARLTQQHLTTSAISADLATQLDQLSSIASSGRDPSLSLASLAQRPSGPTGASNWLILLLALAGGAALGLVAAVLLDRFTSRLRDEHDVQEVIDAPILAGIPQQPGRSANHARAPHLLTAEAREQFRLLREQISLLPDVPAVVVSSSDASDGKTTVATGLAVALAETAHDVILLDLDLAKPDVGYVLDVDERVDNRELTDWKVPLAELLVPVPRYPGLRILPTQQADLVTMETVIERFPQILAEARQLSQWVIIDAPPITAVSSSLRLIQVCDAVVLAVRPRQTNRSRLILARNVLNRVSAHLAGVVLVGQTIAKLNSPYGYGYGELWQVENGLNPEGNGGPSRRRRPDAGRTVSRG